MKKFLITLFVSPIFCCLCALHAEEPEDEQSAVAEKLIFDTEWKGESITLPPEFAPDMKLKGIEVIRFAPGMFDPKSDAFFSYAFVFSVSIDQKFTKEVIQAETLVYYRGLAQSLLKSRGKEIDVSEFTFEMKRAEAAVDTAEGVAAEGVTQYSGELNWIEPFATLQPQILQFELQSWSDPETERNYLFVCTSPKKPEEAIPIWNELRKIRQSFSVKSGKEE